MLVSALVAPGAPALAAARESPVVPSYVPFTLFLLLEAVAVLASLLVFARRRPPASGALLLCSRCAWLHKRTEAFGRGADAVAVGALAFLVALPFVAAGYESGVTLTSIVLAASAVAAVLAAGAEADFLVRAAAARLWPHFTWSAEPTRIVGGGARWLGVIFALYLFEPRDAATAGTLGIGELLGGVGTRLVLDLPSTWTIYAAAAIIVVAQAVALSARWLVPLVFNSLPTTLAASREPHGTSA